MWNTINCFLVISPGYTSELCLSDLASERHSYKWPQSYSECVAVDIDGRPGNVHSFQLKRRTMFQDVLQLRILILGTQKSMVIKRHHDGVRSR